MKRAFSYVRVVGSATALIAATYGLVRLAYGLVLPDAQRDLGFDAAAGGAISSGGSALYVVGALIGFAVATRMPRAIVAAAATVAALGAAGMALAPNVAVFAAAAVVGSAGAGLASPAIVALLRAHPDTASRTGAQTIANSGTGPGLIVAGALALLLLPDWRSAWAVAAVVTALAGVAVLASARRLRFVSAGPDLPPRSWFTAHRRPLAVALIFGAGSAGVWTFGRTLLVEQGMHAAASTLAWIALGAGGAAVALTAGAMAGWGPRRAWAITVAVAAGATLLLVPAAGSIVSALAVCAAFGWAYTAATGALIAWTERIAPDRAAAGTAMLFVMLVLGQGIGAAALGVVAGAFGMVLAVAAAGMLTAVALAGASGGQPDAIRDTGARECEDERTVPKE